MQLISGVALWHMTEHSGLTDHTRMIIATQHYCCLTIALSQGGKQSDWMLASLALASTSLGSWSLELLHIQARSSPDSDALDFEVGPEEPGFSGGSRASCYAFICLACLHGDAVSCIEAGSIFPKHNQTLRKEFRAESPELCHMYFMPIVLAFYA